MSNNIELSKVVSGEEAIALIRRAARAQEFEYWDFGGEVSVSREFPEHVQNGDAAPTLQFGFGTIDPEKQYDGLEVTAFLGAEKMEEVYLDASQGAYNAHLQLFERHMNKQLSEKDIKRNEPSYF